MASGNGSAARSARGSAYGVAFIDWLACACAGSDQRAARAARASGDGLLGEVAFVATAGHVLDFDDTFAAGVAHLSAACAPAALVLAAHLGLSQGAMLEAYAQGFEAMAAVAAAGHPALYNGGWHPTAVYGPIGAAVTASRLLGLSPALRQNAIAASVLRAGGTRGAFGSDGKSLQVGHAAAAGVQAALLARAGASVDAAAIHGPLGFARVMGARWPSGGLDGGFDATGALAIERNWIKLYPSCLGTHSPIEGAVLARSSGFHFDQQPLEVFVHPVARQAAHLDSVTDGLSAKFSIPYCVAWTLMHGSPGMRDFAGIDDAARDGASRVEVHLDASLRQFGAVITASGRELARVPCPRGAPERPVAASDLQDKVTDLAGDRLDHVLTDPEAPATGALDAAMLRPDASVSR
jgi:2-methylcitrate dehydratase PrpD